MLVSMLFSYSQKNHFCIGSGVKIIPRAESRTSSSPCFPKLVKDSLNMSYSFVSIYHGRKLYDHLIHKGFDLTGPLPFHELYSIFDGCAHCKVKGGGRIQSEPFSCALSCYLFSPYKVLCRVFFYHVYLSFA